MNLKSKIEKIFEGNAFKRPLFYNYTGGLRFQLSEGGHFLNQFITAHNKAMEICKSIFNNSSTVTVCVVIYSNSSLAASLSTLKALRLAGLYPNIEKEHWCEAEENDHAIQLDCPLIRHFVAFSLPSEYLINALWCALSADFGHIEPRPRASIYLFNLDKKIIVLPYDDRGMDVVGPNKSHLKELYLHFGHFLLGHDRAIMDEVFS